MTGTPAPDAPAVARRFGWVNALLVASLAINLLIGGAVVARFFVRPPFERFAGASYAQLIPRRFLGDLDRARRAELLAILRQYRDEFRDGRNAARAASVKLADALESDPYDPAKAADAVQDYAKTGNDMVARGAAAALEFVEKLSPGERHLMAERLRQRAQSGGGD